MENSLNTNYSGEHQDEPKVYLVGIEGYKSGLCEAGLRTRAKDRIVINLSLMECNKCCNYLLWNVIWFLGGQKVLGKKREVKVLSGPSSFLSKKETEEGFAVSTLMNTLFKAPKGFLWKERTTIIFVYLLCLAY